jgi:hypothetical protein
MLERIKTVVGEFSGIRVAENAEDTTIMSGIILLHRLFAPAAELSQTQPPRARLKGSPDHYARGSCATNDLNNPAKISARSATNCMGTNANGNGPLLYCAGLLCIRKLCGYGRASEDYT